MREQATSFCFLFLLISAFNFAFCEISSTSTPPPRPHAFIISIPLAGHINPLLAIGEELLLNGWKVTIASTTHIRKHVEIQSPELSKYFLDLGVCPYEKYKKSGAPSITPHEAAVRSTTNEDFATGAIHMFEWSNGLQCCLFNETVNGLDVNFPPSIVIGDFATHSAIDIAEYYKVPSVLNNADLLGMVSPYILSPVDYNPAVFSPQSKFDLSREANNLFGLIYRVIYTLARSYFSFSSYVSLTPKINEARNSVGLAPIESLEKRTRNSFILVNGAFPLEYSRPIPPQIIMTGAMVPSSKYNNDGNLWQKEMTEEEKVWFGQDDNRHIIFMSMGTLASLTSPQMNNLTKAFLLLKKDIRVLWKLSKDQQQNLFDNLDETTEAEMSENIKITNWVSSQFGILSHPKLSIFISHCGINSAYESIFYNKSLICLPMFFDQRDMALRIQDNGLGLMLNKNNLTVENIHDAISKMIYLKKFDSLDSKVSAMAQAIRLTGGVYTAARIIQFLQQQNQVNKQFITADILNDYPFYAKFSLDVYVVITLLFLILIFIIKSLFKLAVAILCCRCFCCRRSSKNKIE